MSVSPEAKMRSRDRVLILEVIDETKPRTLHGLLDVSNKLHAIANEQTGLWCFKYDRGVLPEALKCQFTSFKAMRKFAEDYYTKRNLRIKEVID